MYSAWLESNEVENNGEIETELDIPFDPLFLDWEGKKEQLNKDSKFKLTSTPIFLLGDENKDENKEDENKDENKGISGVATFFIVLTCIIVLIILVFVGLYFYKRVVKNEYIPIDKHLFKNRI